MGLANLVPGLSGGTMLLASGIYPRFIEAVADLSRFRYRRVSVLLLVVVGVGAGLAVLILAGPLRDLVIHRRWVMYSAFIGLTLGGVPLVWRLIQGAGRISWAGLALGFLAMAALALAQSGPAAAGDAGSGPLGLVVAGAAGAAAMVLPGLSGGYLLLVLGVYLPILSAVDGLLDALAAGNPRGLVEPAAVLFPFAAGIAVGVTLISNAVRLALRRWRRMTLAALLGLLLGAVIGLWPFQAPVAPTPGDMVGAPVIAGETPARVEPTNQPLASFRPRPHQAAVALVLVAAGFVVTWGISRMGSSSAGGAPGVAGSR